MSDVDLRELQQKVDYGDESAKIKLEREWIRRGLGWHGEVLPKNSRGQLVPWDERGVYAWRLKDSYHAGFDLAPIQLVYVPEGDVQCVDATRRRSDSQGTCHVKPLYVGRFPVMSSEVVVWQLDLARGSTPDPNPARPLQYYSWNKSEGAYLPIVNISYEEACSFGEWAGLRLPNGHEWKWAALGPTRVCVHGKDGRELELSVDEKVHGIRHSCSQCLSGDERHVKYPWNNQPPRAEHSVWDGHPTFGRGPYSHGRPAPVIDCELCLKGDCFTEGFCGVVGEFTDRAKLVPARPQGASWCGVHDMAGNVWEWIYGLLPRIMGGSFKTPEDGGVAQPSLDQACTELIDPSDDHDDDIGFRVALDAVPD